jgi:hypothetical protein
MLDNALRHPSDAEPAEVTAAENDMVIDWHLLTLADPTLPPVALRFAGLIMHRFHHQSGYADITIGDAVRRLRMSRRKLNRARNVLLRRRWIVIVRAEQLSQSSRLGLGPVVRIGLGNGPAGLPTDDIGDGT